MATPQTGQPIANGNQVEVLNQLLSTLFGDSKTTTNSANIDPLMQLFAQMQSQGGNYNQLLESIFAQAGGAIPGMQAAYSNAVGARSGGNSAVQANLERLMQQTALLGQQQVVQQQAQNNQTMAQTAGNIANVTQTQKVATPGKAKDLAGILAVAQGAMKLTGSNNMEELYRKISGGGRGESGAIGANATTSAAAAASPQGAPVTGAVPAGGVTSAAAPAAIDLAPFLQAPGMGSMQWTGGQQLQPGFTNFSDQFAFGANQLAGSSGVDPLDALIQITGGFGTAPGYAAPAPAPSFNFSDFGSGFGNGGNGGFGGGGFGANDWEMYF